MTYIYLFLILFNTSSAIAFFFKRRIEETIFISIASSVLILFLSGVFFNLKVGYYIFMLMQLPIFIFNIYYLLKYKPKLKNYVLTPGLFVFIVMYLLFIWISYGLMAMAWDEFSHWALVVKNMFYLNNFGLGSDSNVVAKNYLSGTSIFQYFLMKLNGKYDESFLFFGMNIMTLSFIIPLFRYFNKFKHLSMYIFLFVIIIIPSLFYANYYRTLYVDALLGFAFAYSLYIYIFNSEEGLRPYNYINLSLALAMLAFIKDIGIYLAFVTFSTILIDNIFAKNENKKAFVIRIIKVVTLAIPLVIVKLLWILTLSNNLVVSSTKSTSGFLSNFFLLFSLNRTGNKFLIINNFIEAIFSKGLFGNQIFISFFSALIIFFCIAYIVVEKASKTNEKRTYIIMVIMAELGAIGYALMLLLSYLTVFSEYEALMLASYERYTLTYILGLSILLMAIIVKKNKNDFANLFKVLVISLVILVVSTNFSVVTDMTIFARGFIAESKEFRDDYVISKSALKNITPGKYVHFISTNNSGLDYWVMRYEMVPNNVIKSINWGDWSIGTAYSENDIWTVNKTSGEWADDLKKEYDYVYLFNIDERFISSFKNNFNISPDDIKDNQLYKVNKQSKTNSVLELISYD